MLNNQKGFLLIGIIFIMLLLAVTVISINYYSVTQLRMAATQVASIQTGYALTAIVEQSVWRLTDNLFWRTSETGEAYTFNGATYTRIVRTVDTLPFSHPSGYADAVTIQVAPPGATQSFQRSFRYYMSKITPAPSLNTPGKISMDPSGNLLIADSKNHRVITVSPSTAAITPIAGTGTAGYNAGMGLWELGAS